MAFHIARLHCLHFLPADRGRGGHFRTCHLDALNERGFDRIHPHLDRVGRIPIQGDNHDDFAIHTPLQPRHAGNDLQGVIEGDIPGRERHLRGSRGTTRTLFAFRRGAEHIIATRLRGRRRRGSRRGRPQIQDNIDALLGVIIRTLVAIPAPLVKEINDIVHIRLAELDFVNDDLFHLLFDNIEPDAIGYRRSHIPPLDDLVFRIPCIADLGRHFPRGGVPLSRPVAVLPVAEHLEITHGLAVFGFKRKD